MKWKKVKSKDVWYWILHTKLMIKLGNERLLTCSLSFCFQFIFKKTARFHCFYIKFFFLSINKDLSIVSIHKETNTKKQYAAALKEINKKNNNGLNE